MSNARTPLYRVGQIKKHFPVLGGVLRRTKGYVRALDGVDLGSAQVKCFDILGNEISIEISINDNSISFNPAQLDGVYIIYIKTPDGVSVERVILNRK